MAHVLSLTTSKGTCTQRRPVRCSLGTLAPGATVTVRTRTRVLVVAELRSIVVVSSDTQDTNMTNNMAEANVTTFSSATVHAQISAPPSERVAEPLNYRVFASLGRGSPPGAVRLCTTQPESFVQVRAPGTFKYKGVHCRNFAFVRAGQSVSFLVSAFPSATGRVTPSVRATAVGAAREARASADILVGAAAACPASVATDSHPTDSHATASGRRPLAYPAC